MRLFSPFAVLAAALSLFAAINAAAAAEQSLPNEEQPTFSAYWQGLKGRISRKAYKAMEMKPALSARISAADKDLIERGRLLAVASDCGSCHTGRGEGDKIFAGGYEFKMPMGQIVSGNITPSKTFGIGNWSEADFARAVRDGVLPNGRRLYPAMPYTEYSLITDADIHALYAYFMLGVAPVDAPVAAKTQLNFPFNIPGAMPIWNMLFLNKKRFEPDMRVSAEINRGRYLADGPAHCGTCHTPRNFMLASKASRYLGGGNVGGWWAPNITSDPVSGLGGWSRQEIVTYLKTGHVRDKSQAGGPMAEAVELSFRYMGDADLQAIAAYLKTVPPLPAAGQEAPAYAAHKPKNTDFRQYEFPLPGSGAPASSDAGSLDGAVLYNSACASCHGINGEGADDGSSPSLLANRAVGIANPYSLIMTVAYGLERKGADGDASMPGFLYATNPIYAAMNEAQIAAVVTYVRQNFGAIAPETTEADVKLALSGGKMPFLIAYAAPLFWAGAALLALGLLWLLRRLYLRRKGSSRKVERAKRFAKSAGRKRAKPGLRGKRKS